MEERFLNSARNCTALACTAVLGVLVLGTNKLSAQLFLACMEFYNVGRKEASFPFTLVHIMRSISGPLTGYLGRKYGALFVTEVGCFLCVVGVGGCFFAKNITTVSVLWGVIYGLGTGLGSLLIPHILRDYFDKNYDKAHGYYVAGSSIAGILLPLLADVLLIKYGLPGTFLVVSALILNFIVATFILKSLKRGPHMYHPSTPVIKNTKVLQVEIEELSVSKLKDIGSIETEKSVCQNTTIDSIDTKKSKLNAKVEHFDVSTEPESLCAPDSKITHNSNRTKINKDANIERQTKENGIKNGNIVLEVLKIFLDPTFVIISITQCLFLFVYQMFTTTVIDMARDFGISEDQEVYTVMNLYISDVVGRIALGYVTDGGCLSQLNFYVMSFILLGIMFSAMTLIKSFLVLMFALFVIGLLYGGLAMISVGLMFGFIEKEKMIIAMPSRFFLYSFYGFSKPFLIEFFREGQGSYNGFMFLLTGVCVFIALLSLLLPAAKRFREKQNPK